MALPNYEKNLKKLSENNDDLIIKTEVYLTIPAMSAGSAGYLTKEISIPQGYKSCGAIVSTGQIAASNGLQIIPISGHNFFTNGTHTMYFNYYAPKTISVSFAITIQVICVKEDFVK